jgi:UDP-GlcNAc:undecaprenyl-phosphate/decaprenyl-phosphate GlcNAc-1-phosphate transferase
MVALGGLAIAALASLLLAPVVIRAAVGWGLFDHPDGKRRVHTRPVPRVGGVVVFLAMLLGLAAAAVGDLATGGELLRANAAYVLGIVAGTALLFGTGLLDDVRGLRPLTKLSVQILAACIAYYFGFQVERIGFGPDFGIDLGWLSLPVTLIWIVGVTNAFNLIDGLDGLATGIALVALSTTAVAAQMLGNTEVVIVCLALIGALVGFLRYNFNPARIFLGDSGSLFIGFLLAVLSVHGSMKSATAVLVLVPLSALALPLLDTLLAIGRRWLRGVPLSSADSRHIHHRLLAVGFTHRTSVVVLYCVAAALAAAGIAVAFAPQREIFLVAAVGGVVCGAILLYGLRHLDYHEFLEAGVVLLGGVLRVRQVISDQIHARDLAHVIRQSTDLDAVNNALRSHVGYFSFLDMEVCRESAPAVWLHTLEDVQQQRAWKVDVPVELRNRSNQDPFVLRIWCGQGRTFRPRGAERVAAILATTLERWLADMRAADPAYESAAPLDLLDYAARSSGSQTA